MKVAEFFVALGIDIEKKDSKKLSDLTKSLGSLDVKAIATVTGLGAMYVALRKVMGQALSTGLALQRFSVETGMSSRKLQQWSFVAEQMGASASDVESAIKSLQLSTAAIKLGQGNLKPFQMLGIDPNQNPFDMLEDVAQKIKNLDPGLTRLITQQMGISDAMLNVLKASNDVRNDIEKQFYLREKEIKQLNSLRSIWIKLRQEIFYFSNMIAVNLAPTFRNLSRFTTDAKDKFLELIGGVESLKYIIPIVAAIFAPMQTALLLIALLIDDLYSSMSGAESAFKPWFDMLAKGWIRVEKLISKANNAVKKFISTPKYLGKLAIDSLMMTGAIPNVERSQKKSSQTKIEINVNGVQDSDTVARKVRRELNSLFSTTTYQAEKDNL